MTPSPEIDLDAIAPYDAEAAPPVCIEADFSAPRSKTQMAEEQRRFMTSLPGPVYDIELPEED